MKGLLVVVDLGGTNLRVAALRGEEMIALKEMPSIAALPPEEGLGVLRGYIRDMAGGEAEGVVLGFPGVITREGVLLHSPHLKSYEGVDLVGGLKELGIRVLVENDANLYTLGEGFRGAAKGRRHFCCLTLGTGVGGGVVIEGKLLKGARGVASELGHMVVDEDGMECYCGSRGCLEAYASGSAILRMAQEKGFAVSSAKEVARLAFEGDDEAKGIFEEMGRYLGVGLANIVNIFNPEVIVIGGKVADAWPLFGPRALEEMKKRAFPYSAEGVQVTKALLGDEAALWGGVALMKQRDADR
ncbi:MAG: ROK family protein [Deltaproteobacteria bacterium]|nr:MAG: ROK family protein [Deltaproteobacteria bacterium]